MSDTSVLVTIEDGVGTITLNRPETHNAINQAMWQALAAATARMRDDDTVHSVILTGAGSAFCSGGDVAQMLDTRRMGQTFQHSLRVLHHWLPQLINLEKPVIAAVDGPAYGGGLGLALAADFILATRRARFCAVFGRIGLVPDVGVMYLLPRIVGRQKAKELVFTARAVGADEARKLGIVYDVVADAVALANAARGLAKRFGAASNAAIGMAKTVMNQSFELDARAIADLEIHTQTLCRSSPYHMDAVRRFNDKQPPAFDWDRPH